MAALRALGVDGREVRVAGDFEGLDALVLPGGESTTMTLGIEREGIARPIAEFARSGKPVLATCAGAIVLDDAHLGLLDISCERNAYGSQSHSFEGAVQLSGERSFPGIFIRAPKLVRVGDAVATIATLGDEVVGVRAGAITAYTFHPELSDDPAIHQEFISTLRTRQKSRH